MPIPDEDYSDEDKAKLRVLRKLAKEAFDDIDEGRFVAIERGGLKKFMDSLVAKARRE
jgi:hypothetical protein